MKFLLEVMILVEVRVEVSIEVLEVPNMMEVVVEGKKPHELVVLRA